MQGGDQRSLSFCHFESFPIDSTTLLKFPATVNNPPFHPYSIKQGLTFDVLKFRQLSCYGDIALVGICTLDIDPSKQNDNNDDNDDDDTSNYSNYPRRKVVGSRGNIACFS